jgi:hypothetical protein
MIYMKERRLYILLHNTIEFYKLLLQFSHCRRNSLQITEKRWSVRGTREYLVLMWTNSSYSSDPIWMFYVRWENLLIRPLIEIQLLTGERWVSRFLPLTCAVVPFRFDPIRLTLCTYASIQSCMHQILHQFQKCKARFDSVKSLRSYFDH